jgi:hypothetical protein
MVKSDGTDAMPVPLKDEVCVPRLSATDSVAEKLPADEGSKSTLIVQDAPAFNALPQELPVIMKEAAFVPVTLIEVIGRAALPALVRVKAVELPAVPTAWLPKLRLAGVSAACGAAGVVPEPASDDVCVPTASTIDKLAVKLPAAAGEKVSEMVHEAPAASADPQVFAAMAKLLAFVPDREMEVMDNDALPALVRVKVCALLVVPVVTLPKFAVAGVSAACGAGAAVPVPVRVEIWVPTASTADTLAEKLPMLVGEKVMAIVQDLPAASDVPQVFALTMKVFAFVPAIPIEVIESAALPALVRVKVCALPVVPVVTLPKFAVAGVSAACGVGAVVPVPVRAEVCVPTASTTDKLAVKPPAVAGRKVTARVQDLFAASDEPQVLLLTLKLLAFAPLRLTEVIASAAFPALVRVNVCALLVVPVVTLPKFAVAGVRAACGAAAAVPLQVKAMDCWGIGDAKFALRLAVRVSTITGSQVTAMEQLDPAARLLPQLSDSLKPPGLLPEKLKKTTDTATVPLF